LRNMATLGGAVVSAHPWADIPTALVALGAEARWQDGQEGRAPLEELYRGEFRGLFRKSVLTEVRLPPWDGAFAYAKVGRSATDIALLNACCGLGLREGTIAWARVAVGARPERGERLPWAEEALVGRKPSPLLWNEVGALVAARIEVGDDRRASGTWRRQVAGVLVARALARAAEKADR
ncbi:MAG: FAD binding domain-containing protein, partial [Candidatus Bipolaricaulota bacterium]|nr:FAD binding domain-containing protein [Candidatus Bipolaricaulota bacterium]